MDSRPYNLLILCTGNSARSILAESILNKLGGGRVRGFSAGSHPTGNVNPLALELLNELGYPTEGARSKSWDEFAAPAAAPIDFVVTVCDNAAGEVCPIWPGHPVTGHWGIPDPAAVEGSKATRMAAFRQAFDALQARIEAFLALPLTTIDKTSLKARMQAIGEMELAAQAP
jgi:arsenate reductase (thioredoxin)